MQLLSIALLIIGLILLVTELIIPGFGVFGIIGAILIVVSLFITVSYFKFGIFTVLIEMIFISIGIYLLIKKFKERQLLQRIILDETISYQKDFANLEEFIGREGFSKTTLRPFGDVEFNGILMEVVSDNGYIEKNKKVICTKVLQNKLFVIESNLN